MSKIIPLIKPAIKKHKYKQKQKKEKKIHKTYDGAMPENNIDD